MTDKEVEITIKLSPGTWSLLYGHIHEAQSAGRTGKIVTPDEALNAVLYAYAAKSTESPKSSKRMQDMLLKKVKEMALGTKKK